MDAQMVEIKAEAVPAQSFTGRVWFISPALNEETRTVKALVNISNADQKLKSGPVTAVLDSGVRKLIYVEKSQGRFAAVEIVAGPRTDDAYPALSGLNEGDKVVTRGNLLLDSQFQIRGLPSLFYKEGQAAMCNEIRSCAFTLLNEG